MTHGGDLAMTVSKRCDHSNPSRGRTPTTMLGLISLALVTWGVVVPAQAQQREPEVLPPSVGQAPIVPAQPVTITDVVAMQRSGLDDQVIVNLLRQNGMVTPLSTAELISLRQHGVSNQVIAAMQAASPPVAAPAIVQSPPAVVATRPSVVHVYEAPPPVVIRSYPVPAPYRYHPHYHLHYGRGYHHGHGRSNTSVSFGFHWR